MSTRPHWPQVELVVSWLRPTTRDILGSIGAGDEDHGDFLLRVQATSVIDELEINGLLANGALTRLGVLASWQAAYELGFTPSPEVRMQFAAEIADRRSTDAAGPPRQGAVLRWWRNRRSGSG